MPFLTKELADTLCTAIVLGFVKTDGSRTQIQYANATEQIDYKTVESKFSALGVTLSISQSVSQPETAYIVAKTPKVPSNDYTKYLTSDYWKYLQAITKSANALKTAPYGAYIGGMSTVNKLFLIGPSNLDQYDPVYRAADDAAVGVAYSKAVKDTNSALDCLKKDTPAAKPAGLSLDFTDLNSPIITPFINGKLFKSYHGMIQAIVKYQTTIDTNSFIFEISLGNNTSKVSSCFPCCTLMTANNTPPTSTHFGRGDNWNIPQNCNSRSAWESKITSYYESGIKSMSTNKKTHNLTEVLKINAVASKIPSVFLEALTFESKFTEKIINTLA
ncbi:hypothetical protein [Psychroflexus sp. MES1-P1E]|uniref:hypothetical protein n=1 Tax=Psychroflexus sp. MES1-P1E TaxID=2058320 RepID=UPI000C7B7933|nr:hypothetical protein [Psychroflexus sp. MES1-P1E]PKG44078.1 hypothetical protein CXF67_01480 [Psychroflexus sp. MES1-P1E]